MPRGARRSRTSGRGIGAAGRSAATALFSVRPEERACLAVFRLRGGFVPPEMPGMMDEVPVFTSPGRIASGVPESASDEPRGPPTTAEEASNEEDGFNPNSSPGSRG